MEPEVNVPLLRKVVEWVEYQEQLPGEERTWYQRRWIIVSQTGDFCGTHMCVAGKVALDDGWTPTVRGHCSEVTKDGETRPVRDVAQDLLGIGRISANALFDQGNNAVRIRKCAEEIAGEPL